MSADLFATGAEARVTLDWFGGEIPVLAVDGIFADPQAVRAAALDLPYGPGTAHYPGRTARHPAGDVSLENFLRNVIALIERDYLPRLPVLPNGQKLSRVRGVDTDFAVTDRHPDELDEEQRKPHVDFVPVFGLVYLNEEERGGTLFYKALASTQPANSEPGYPAASYPGLELAGRIAGRFNRLAIYPGFILHSGEIEGDWITSDERFQTPRLTQRIMFYF
jgi:hypothetical protein